MIQLVVHMHIGYIFSRSFSTFSSSSSSSSFVPRPYSRFIIGCMYSSAASFFRSTNMFYQSRDAVAGLDMTYVGSICSHICIYFIFATRRYIRVYSSEQAICLLIQLPSSSCFCMCPSSFEITQVFSTLAHSLSAKFDNK